MPPNGCVFCDISVGRAPSNMIFSDQDVAVISDMNPASDFHFLVIPKAHYPNPKRLTKNEVSVVNKLLLTGKRILEEKRLNLSDSRLGFHWPPFNSIEHLHLHVISPASKISYFNKLIFLQNSLWFVSPEYLLKRLEKH